MIHSLKQVFHSGKFVIGFVIFTAIAGDGVYLSAAGESAAAANHWPGNFPCAGDLCECLRQHRRTALHAQSGGCRAREAVASKLNDEDRVAMQEWLVAAGVSEAQIDTEDPQQLLELW